MSEYYHQDIEIQQNRTSLEAHQEKKDWERLKILEINETLNMDAEYEYEDRGSVPKETEGRRGQIRKINLQMRQFEDSRKDENYDISKFLRSQK